MDLAKQEKVVISLTGGLGNQLFQLSCGLAYSGDEKLCVIANLGDPRIREDGMPEIFQYKLPDNVILLQGIKYNLVARKLGNLILRISTYSSAVKFFSFWKIIGELACLLLTRLVSESDRINFPNGIGFDPNLKIRRKNGNLLIGYFQTYKWASERKVLENITSLKLKYDSDWVKSMKIKSEIENPLILHLRMGDYLSEQNFGIPSPEYFLEACKRLWGNKKFSKIWIYTDDKINTSGYLPNWILERSEWVDNPNASAAETLESMRFGHAYVLSNSTFGWWGAFLSHKGRNSVVVPYPWFKNLTEPLNLIPDSWIKMPSGY